jgi:glycosyltransferase involved in cell wall biosynthesis
VLYNWQLINDLKIDNQHIYQSSVKIMLQWFCIKLLMLPKQIYIVDAEDIYHLWGTLLLSWVFKSRVTVIAICHLLDPSHPIDFRLKRYALSHCVDRIITPSQSVADIFVDQTNVRVLNPPLRFSCTAPRHYHEFPDRIRLLFVGSIESRKNVAYHIDVLSKLPTHFELTIAAQNVCQSELGRCQDKIKQLGVENRVSWKFNLTDDDLLTVFKDSHVFLFLSLLEGFGMVNIEAMAHGLPVVLSDIAAHQEITSDGVYGKLAPLGNSDAVASHVLACVQTPDIYNQLSRNSIKRAAQFYWTEEKVQEAILL